MADVPVGKGKSKDTGTINDYRPSWAKKIYKGLPVEPFFLQAQHPKSSVEPTRTSVEKMLGAGYLAQRKVNGHRAQIHISADGRLVAFTRSGTKHTRNFTQATTEHLVTNFKPDKGWTILDAEWQKQEDKVYLFDLLQVGSELFSNKSFEERYTMLRDQFTIGPGVGFLVLLKDVASCLSMLGDPSPFTEGLVWRLVKSPGFHDSSILRCRKSGVFYEPEKLT